MSNICINCNTDNPIDASYCRSCGFNLSKYNKQSHRLLEGIEKEINGNIAEATNIYKELIDAGFEYANYNLALNYIFHSDNIATQNHGLKLLKETAQTNDISAINALGLYYYEGIEGLLPVDYYQACYWFNKSYSLDQNAYAARFLGLLHLDGEGGLTKDIHKAFSLLKEATENGDDDAPAFLGWAYEKGIEVPVNLKKAKTYYTIASERGSEVAIQRLNKQKFWYI